MKFNCYVLVGIPGCGKSTFAKTRVGANILSIDSYIEKIAKFQHKKYSEVWKESVDEAYSLFWKDLWVANKNPIQDIVIDKTNLSYDVRAKLLRNINRRSYKVTCIDFGKVPLEICLKRTEQREKETGKDIPDYVVKKMFYSYQKPSYEEGFDLILEFTGKKFVESK